MKELPSNLEIKKTEFVCVKTSLRWSVIVASFIFSFSAYAMVHLYGIVHWEIMFPGETLPDERFKGYVFMLLGALMWLRIIFAVLATVYAGLSFVQGPKILAFIASIFAGLAVGTIFIMM